MSNQHNQNWATHYKNRDSINVYPTEFVVRLLLATYPNLSFEKPHEGDTILDVGFGDGRNTKLLCELGLNVSGIEVSEEIVLQTKRRLKNKQQMKLNTQSKRR